MEILLLVALLAPPSNEVHGAARLAGGDVLTWGASLQRWTTSPLRSRTVKPGPYGEGGCVTDLDGDGRDEFVGVRSAGLGALLWIPLGGDGEERVDDEVEMADCLPATLFGRRGFLMIHRGAQVRFYERTAPGEWRSRDIYSIYTPSYQRGLAISDVDGDGLADILCGNYWIRSPRQFEESWRLFAIHTWFEDPDSAALRIVVPGARSVIAAQARVSPARFARFDAPADPTQPWTPTPIPHNLGRVRALALWNGEPVAGGDNGVLYRGATLSRGKPVNALLPLDRNRLFVAGPGGVEIISPAGTRRRR